MRPAVCGAEPAMTAPTVCLEAPDPPEIRALLAAADAFYAALYPAERNYLLDVAALAAPGVAFYVARLSGRAVGCGAIVLADGRDCAELKRMYVGAATRAGLLGASNPPRRRDGYRPNRVL